MIVSYDITLVLLSISLAILGAYTGLSILPDGEWFGGKSFKIRVAAAALSIGGSIWAMHFLGMLALNLPVEVNYAVAPTTTSLLVAILVTGLGIYAGTSGHLGKYEAVWGGIIIGLGVTAMHYIGMEAVRAACSVTYSYGGVFLSFVLGAAVCILALKFLDQAHNRHSLILGAIALGLAISSIHYLGMLNTRFAFADGAVFVSEPVLKPGYLASLVSLATFLLCGTFLALALPSERVTGVVGQPVQFGQGSVFPHPGGGSEIGAPGQRSSSISEPALASEPRFAPLSRRGSVGVTAGGQAPPMGDRSADPGADLGLLRGRSSAPPPMAASSLAVQSKTGTKFIDLAAVLVVSADGHYTHVSYIGSDGKLDRLFCERSITSLATVLPAPDFVRVHRSHIVNITHVNGYNRRGDSGELILRVGGAPRIPVSRSRYADVVALVQKTAGAA